MIDKTLNYGNVWNVDPAETDQGVEGNGRSVNAIITDQGSYPATLMFAHTEQDAETTYTVSTNETIPSNFHLIVENGAVIKPDSGVTLIIQGGVTIPSSSVFAGDGTVTYGTSYNPTVDDILRIGRSKLSYSSADEIKIGAGGYQHLGGTKPQVLRIDGELTKGSMTLTGADWYYLYFDDSAIVTLGSNVLTATEIIYNTTEPAWSDSYHGWYNGRDKCFGAFYVNGSNNVAVFTHDGARYIEYDVRISDLADTDIDTSDVPVTLTIPKFSTKACCIFNGIYNTDTQAFRCKVNDSSATGSKSVGKVSADSALSRQSMDVFTDSAQKIEVYSDQSGASTLAVLTTGFHLPTGM